uniref:universal stress protein n=1 Tax=uncultured Lutibacter sp. TaxID=437739 RepID=UPI0026125789
ALELYKKTACNFYLLHVTLIPYYPTGDYPIIGSSDILEKTFLNQTKIDLKKLIKRISKLPKNSKHHFYTLSSYNSFIDAVKTHIEEKNIDLVIMGTKGASGLSEVIVGSNTGDLITKVKHPVLIVPEKASYTVPKEIAFPTDYNIFYQPKILNSITELAKMYNATVRILHIAKKDEILTDSQIENKEFLNNFFMDEKHSFHRLTNKKIEEGVQCFVESRDIDMIIMVAKNLNLFQRILFKPTVEEISYHIEVPFLVLHE